MNYGRRKVRGRFSVRRFWPWALTLTFQKSIVTVGSAQTLNMMKIALLLFDKSERASRTNEQTDGQTRPVAILPAGCNQAFDSFTVMIHTLIFMEKHSVKAYWGYIVCVSDGGKYLFGHTTGRSGPKCKRSGDGNPGSQHLSLCSWRIGAQSNLRARRFCPKIMYEQEIL